MTVSPNPTKGLVYVSYELPNTYKRVFLNLHNGQGHLVKQLDISKHQYLCKFNCDNLSPGIYLLSLVVDGLRVETVKLSVSN